MDYATDISSQISYCVATDKIYYTGFTGSIAYPDTCPSTPNPYCFAPTYTSITAPWNIFVSCLDMQNINVGFDADNNPIISGELNIFPNPTAENFTVLIPQESTGKSTILVYNSLGQIVDTQTLASGQTRATFETASWASGVYTIQVTQGTKIYHKKAVVQH